MTLTWPLDPTVYLGLVAALIGHGLLARGREDVTRRHSLFFGIGLLLLWAALETPIEPIGDHNLQSAHMVQHMLLIAVAPPFLLLGLSPSMATSIRSIPILGALLEPVPAAIFYGANVLLWHIPALFDRALGDELLHVVEHLAFIGAGLVYWWPAIRATTETNRRPLGPTTRIAYLYMGSIPMVLVSLTLQFSRVLFYQGYAGAPLVVPGMDHVIDQSTSGAVMFVIDMAVIGFDFLVVGYAWLMAAERADLDGADPGRPAALEAGSRAAPDGIPPGSGEV